MGVLNSLGSLENFLIVDIGGRSTEFIYDDDKKIVSKSVNIGVVSLSELFFDKLPPPEKSVLLAREYIESHLLESNAFDGRLLVGVAGTFTSLASIFLKQTQFNEKEIHLTELKNEDVYAINEELLQLNEPQIITSYKGCLLYTSDAADDDVSVDLGGRRIIKKFSEIIRSSIH